MNNGITLSITLKVFIGLWHKICRFAVYWLSNLTTKNVKIKICPDCNVFQE